MPKLRLAPDLMNKQARSNLLFSEPNKLAIQQNSIDAVAGFYLSSFSPQQFSA
jgi:hypothetical protein